MTIYREGVTLRMTDKNIHFRVYMTPDCVPIPSLRNIRNHPATMNIPDTLHLINQTRIRSSHIAPIHTQLEQAIGWYLTLTFAERQLCHIHCPAFLIAFLQKNRLFPDKPIDDVPEIGEMDLEEAQRLSMMMAGMEEHSRRKALGSGTEERGDQ